MNSTSSFQIFLLLLPPVINCFRGLTSLSTLTCDPSNLETSKSPSSCPLPYTSLCIPPTWHQASASFLGHCKSSKWFHYLVSMVWPLSVGRAILRHSQITGPSPPLSHLLCLPCCHGLPGLAQLASSLTHSFHFVLWPHHRPS